MKSFLVGLGVGVGMELLFAPARGEDRRRELGERLNGIAENAQRQEVGQRVRDDVDKESRLGSDDEDSISEISLKKNQARELTLSATGAPEAPMLRTDKPQY